MTDANAASKRVREYLDHRAKLPGMDKDMIGSVWAGGSLPDDQPLGAVLIPADLEVLLAERDSLIDLLDALIDPDDCWFDHHGGCQAHLFLDLEPGEVCPVEQAKRIVKAHEENRS